MSECENCTRLQAKLDSNNIETTCLLAKYRERSREYVCLKQDFTKLSVDLSNIVRSHSDEIRILKEHFDQRVQSFAQESQFKIDATDQQLQYALKREQRLRKLLARRSFYQRIKRWFKHG